MVKLKPCIWAIAALCLLTGCTNSAPPAGETIRKHFETLDTAQMTVKILSNLGNSALEYKVNYEYNKEDNDLMEVVQPESIAGVKLDIAGEHASDFTLRYADAVLDFGVDTAAGVTPADAVADLMYDLCTGEPTEVGTDTIDGVQTVSLHYETIDRQPAIAKKVWIRPDTMAPVYAEMYQDGQNVLSLSFEQFH